METRVSSASKEVLIGDGQPTVLIGERINPTGKETMSKALRNGELKIIYEEAIDQVRAGANILDVNVNAHGVKEKDFLPHVVQAVMETVDVPLCIDSADPEALEAALKVYKGKPLINSVTGEKHSLTKVLQLAKDYGAAVIALLQDDGGIPDNWERRIAIAHKILEAGERLGINRADIIVDCLVLPVGNNTRFGSLALETIRKIKTHVGLNVVAAASNISFGLPGRNTLNSTFIAMAIESGVNCLIADVAKVRSIVLSADLLLDRDSYAKRYTEPYRKNRPEKMDR
jgi:5-methyltetrahydrofolate--homocysteine methyltransferase